MSPQAPTLLRLLIRLSAIARSAPPLARSPAPAAAPTDPAIGARLAALDGWPVID